jgi:hypothetical protein
MKFKHRPFLLYYQLPPDGGEGGGGGGVVPVEISLDNPTDFGQAVVGTTKSITGTLYNPSAFLAGATLAITGPSPFAFSLTPPTLFSMPPYSFTTFQVNFTPPSPGPFTSILRLTQGVTFPLDTQLIGQGVPAGGGGGAGSGIISINPLALSFSCTKVTTSSVEMTFTICNIGGGPFDITSITLGVGTDFTLSTTPQALMALRVYQVNRVRRFINHYFYQSSLTPSVRQVSGIKRSSYPTHYTQAKAQYPLTLPPGACITIGVKFTPTILGLLKEIVNIQTNLGANPFTVSLSGLSTLLCPIAIVTGAVRELILAFITGAGVVTHKVLSSANLNSTEASTLIFNGAVWKQPGSERTMQRLEVFYENLGVATLTATLTCLRAVVGPPANPDFVDTVVKTITIGTAAADGSERSEFFDFTASGEILELKITRPANGGQVSIIGFIPHFAPRGEKVEGQ